MSSTTTDNDVFEPSPTESASAAAPAPSSVDWNKVARFGGILALALVFISLSGMPVGLDKRTILYWINPDVYVNNPDGVGLTLGYLSLFIWPILLGWAVGNEVVLEGMQARKRGLSDLLAGLGVGVLGGLGVVALTFLMGLDREMDPDSGALVYGARDPLVNWNENLYVLLTFNRGWGFALWVWPLLGGVLALIGAGLRLLPDGIRKAIVAAVIAVVSVSIFQFLIDDVIEGVGETINDPGRLSNFFGDADEGRPRVDSVFDGLIDFVYAKTGGLRVQGIILVGVVTAALSLVGSYVTRGRFKASRQAYFDKPLAQRTMSTSVLMFVTALALIILPFFTGKIANELFANVGIFLLLALGLNIVVGLAGILDLGYVAFFAVGGYTTAVLTSAGRGDDWPSWVPLLVTDDGEAVVGGWLIALVFVVIFAAITGLLIGAPVIRMRGDYLAIVTLGFGEIIRLLFLSDWLSGYFGGAQGITNIEAADFGPLGTVSGINPRSVFYLVLFFSAIAIYVSWRLERSRLGRAWMAIREDESVAEAMGINTVNMKLMAFVVGAVLASFSGAIFSAKVGSIFPTSFLILVSIIILVVVIVGGMGNIMGVIVGSLVLIGVLGGPKQPGLLQEFSEYKLLIYGALLIWMMLKRPEGLVPNARRSRELHQDEFLQDAWLKGEVDTGDDDVAVEVAPA